jgi:prolyl-tRNA synthetase
MTIGKRLFEARRTGYPFIVVIGKNAMQPVPEFEVHHIFMDKEFRFSEIALIEYLTDHLNK